MCKACDQRQWNIEFFKRINAAQFPEDLGDPKEASGEVDDYVDGGKDNE